MTKPRIKKKSNRKWSIINVEKGATEINVNKT